MDAVPTAVIVGALVIGGKASQKQTPNMQNIIGIGGVALGLALLQQINEKLASAFSFLIIFGVAAVYFVPMVNNVFGASGKNLGKA
jgi:Na+/phosphate symporter